MGDLELEISSYADGQYQIAARSDMGDTAGPPVRFPLDGLALEHALRAVELAIARSAATVRRIPLERERPVQEFGAQLFRFLFQDHLVGHLAAVRSQAARDSRTVKLRLRIRPPELASLPWELLYDPDRDDYLCLSASLVRHIEVLEPQRPLAATPPLRILGMVARPDDLATIDAENEKQRLREAISGLPSPGSLSLNWVTGQSWQRLQDVLHLENLIDQDWHVFHFIGHGTFDEKRGEGVLALANEDGSTYHLGATDLAMLLGELRSLRLVVLNACESARGSASQVFSSIASVLTRRGIPAVVAMQYDISDQAAIMFARYLYSGIAAQQPIDRAVTLARQAVKLSRPGTLEWVVPVLHLRTSDTALFDLTATTASASAELLEPRAAPVVAEKAPRSQLIGDRYKLEESVGLGSITEVYRARDVISDRIVAVKRIRPHLQSLPDLQEQLREEARRSAALNHPSIVAVYDTGDDPETGTPYIVMEYVDGRTVKELLTDRKWFTLESALATIEGLLPALSYSHQLGIVHKNINPSNVMVTRAGATKVMDFSLTPDGENHIMTMTNDRVFGIAAEYISPELAMGLRVDARSDLYTVGCLLYELLTGSPPFGRGPAISIAYQHLRNQPSPPSRFTKGIPAGVDAIVIKATAKSPSKRYQTAAEMQADIQRAQSGQPIAALADFPPTPLEQPAAAKQPPDVDFLLPPVRYERKAGGLDLAESSGENPPSLRGRLRRPTGTHPYRQQSDDDAAEFWGKPGGWDEQGRRRLWPRRTNTDRMPD